MKRSHRLAMQATNAQDHALFKARCTSARPCRTSLPASLGRSSAMKAGLRRVPFGPWMLPRTLGAKRREGAIDDLLHRPARPTGKQLALEIEAQCAVHLRPGLILLDVLGR